MLSDGFFYVIPSGYKERIAAKKTTAVADSGGFLPKEKREVEKRIQKGCCYGFQHLSYL